MKWFKKKVSETVTNVEVKTTVMPMCELNFNAITGELIGKNNLSKKAWRLQMEVHDHV